MTFAGFSISRLILIFTPFLTCLFLSVYLYLKNERERNELNQVLHSTSRSFEERGFIQNVQEEKLTFADRQNAKFNLLGIDYKFQTLMAIALVLFVVGAILSMFIFKAGILLVLYLGAICGASVFFYVNGLLEKKKQEFSLEFLEKMRDVATFLSVGKSLDNAIIEALESGNISKVMFRELDTVRRDVYTGKKMSEAFMDMYRRLQLDDIRMYAETLAVFEEAGGNLIQVMKANDKFAMNKLELRNEQNIFLKEQKTNQKFIIGFPVGAMVIMFILNPSFFGDFYQTALGQIVGIVCVTLLILGVFLTKKVATIPDSE